MCLIFICLRCQYCSCENYIRAAYTLVYRSQTRCLECAVDFTVVYEILSLDSQFLKVRLWVQIRLNKLKEICSVSAYVCACVCVCRSGPVCFMLG